jgi:soluble lytic murein transglycosylase-like protein
MNPTIIKSIIEVESGYDPMARSSKGAMGLMQLMPQTAQDLGVADPWDPTENITGGTKYISWLLRKYNGDLTKALAAYNAGPNAVDTYDGIPPYQETTDYVRNVLARIYAGGYARE